MDLIGQELTYNPWTHLASRRSEACCRPIDDDGRMDTDEGVLCTGMPKMWRNDVALQQIGMPAYVRLQSERLFSSAGSVSKSQGA